MCIPAQLTHIENYSIHISHFEKKNLSYHNLKNVVWLSQNENFSIQLTHFENDPVACRSEGQPQKQKESDVSA